MIPLWNRHGDVVAYAKVSPEDYEALAAFRWNRTSHGYAKGYVQKREVYMHRLLMGDAARDLDVDHINGDTLDNRRENLRAVTHAENTANRIGLHARNTSGHRGVYRRGRRWRANTAVGGKTRYLGTFATREEAAAVVRRALADVIPQAAS